MPLSSDRSNGRHGDLVSAVLWRRLDRPGHDAVRLLRGGDTWRLDGAVVMAEQGIPCAFAYEVIADDAWLTRNATVRGWFGGVRIEVTIAADGRGGWSMNGVAQPQVFGCLDVDLQFTPATNTLPIRRLDLAVGTGARVRAAWLRFPDLVLEPLEQTYRRTAPDQYAYESAGGGGGGSFRAMLTVNAAGLVMNYGEYWRAEASHA